LVNAFAACCTAAVSAVPLDPNISVSADLLGAALAVPLADEEPNPLPDEQAVESTASPAAARAAIAILDLMMSSSRGMVRSRV
jgi:hypothetical protein